MGLPGLTGWTTLEEDQVHVFSINAKASKETIIRCMSILTSEEMARANRIRIQVQRQEFVIAHAALRLLLAAYLMVSPHSIRFRYSAKSKPYLDLPDGRIGFNMARSSGLVVYALARNAEVGIDVERIREDREIVTQVSKLFSTAEINQLNEMPDCQRTLSFYRCWTRKEAYLKAIGEGLYCPLDSFQVFFEESSTPHLVAFSPALNAPTDWTLDNLTLECGFVGALAYSGAKRKVTTKSFADADTSISDLLACLLHDA